MNLSFITSFYFLLAIYTVAFFVNTKSTIYFVTFVIAEFIGRFSLFSWALEYEYGVFMHLIWAVIYSSCFMLYWLSLSQVKTKNKFTMLFTVIMILFQFIMALDSKESEGNATFLFTSYKYIIVFIHCCIVSTFIEWRNIINFLDEFTSSSWRFFRLNGYFMFYRYNNKKIQATIKKQK